jgi:hypothetical protein
MTKPTSRTTENHLANTPSYLELLSGYIGFVLFSTVLRVLNFAL